MVYFIVIPLSSPHIQAITRYLLQKWFGPTCARVTSDGSILYLDLPSNMVKFAMHSSQIKHLDYIDLSLKIISAHDCLQLGSFLMGWFGVVFKADISSVSEFFAIGLSTGYLGSLTTFSGWNQKMLDLSADGQWVYAVLGFLLGKNINFSLFESSYHLLNWIKHTCLHHKQLYRIISHIILHHSGSGNSQRI